MDWAGILPNTFRVNIVVWWSDRVKRRIQKCGKQNQIVAVNLPSPETVVKIQVKRRDLIVEFPQDLPMLKKLRIRSARLTNIEHLLRPTVDANIEVYSAGWYFHPPGAAGFYKIRAPFCDLRGSNSISIDVKDSKYVLYDDDDCIHFYDVRTIRHKDELLKMMADYDREVVYTPESFEAECGDLWEYLGTACPFTRAKSAYSSNLVC